MALQAGDRRASHGQTRRSDRAQIACARCNSKKVKCNASTGLPCTRCLTTGSECALIDSKRGKYPRNKSKRVPEDASAQSPRAKRARAHDTSEPRDHGRTGAGSIDCGAPLTATADPKQPTPSLVPAESVFLSENGGSVTTPSVSPENSAEMLYAQIAEQGVSQSHRPITNVEHSVFLGEAFSLTYVVQNVLAPFLSTDQVFEKRLHFPISRDDSDRSESSRGQQQILRQIEELRSRGILYQPPRKALEALLSLYFAYFHPAFPVLDGSDFIQKTLTGDMSMLLVNSVLMIAVTMCKSEDLEAAGFSDRYLARGVFYKQAKALYDADLETNKINNVVATFLMSFWWGGPDDQKDSWYWLGIASTLGQSLGMHRSTARSGMDERSRRMWRRVWWSIKTRDTLVSGSIGRPQHMTEWDCDVEMLEPDDIPDVPGSCKGPAAMYSSQMAKLSTIFSRIITSRYAADQFAASNCNRRTLENDLNEFRRNVPSQLHYHGFEESQQQGLWAAMLSMAYNYATILLCRPPRSITGKEETELWGNTTRAFTAANETYRVMEDILDSGVSRLCQIHTIPALFNSLAMHVLIICTSDSVGRELAENRARICLLGLGALQECWPVGGWVFRLFVSIMQKLKRRLPGEFKSPKGESTSTPLTQAIPPKETFDSPRRTESSPSSIPPKPSSSNTEAIPANVRRQPMTQPVSYGWPPEAQNSQGSNILAPQFGEFSFPEFIPNMFALDDSVQSQGHSLDQDGFFDLLQLHPYR